MNNASPHRSIDTLNKLKELDIKAIFLPPYSPNLAHVEYFFRIIKDKFWKYHLNSNVNFSNGLGRREIYYSLVDVTLNSVRKLCIEMKQNAKHKIVQLY